jgi:hypothetical protein
VPGSFADVCTRHYVGETSVSPVCSLIALTRYLPTNAQFLSQLCSSTANSLPITANKTRILVHYCASTCNNDKKTKSQNGARYRVRIGSTPAQNQPLTHRDSPIDSLAPFEAEINEVLSAWPGLPVALREGVLVAGPAHCFPPLAASRLLVELPSPVISQSFEARPSASAQRF